MGLLGGGHRTLSLLQEQELLGSPWASAGWGSQAPGQGLLVVKLPRWAQLPAPSPPTLRDPR